MNISKIEELAKKIYGINITKNPLGNPMYEFTGTELAMFAELIVKECMEQVWYTREDGINGNVSEVIKDRIKQHFGVEE
jgi:hypothetical protein